MATWNRTSVVWPLRLMICLLAFGVVLAGTRPSSAQPFGYSRSPVWCFDGANWLMYFKDVPGSTTQLRLVDCLHVAVRRGDAAAIRGKLYDNGVLFDLGDLSVFWSFTDSPTEEGNTVAIRIEEDRMVLRDYRGRAFAVRDGSASMFRAGYTRGWEQLREVTQSFALADFTIFAVKRDFVIDGSDGWYHVATYDADWNRFPTDPGHQIDLYYHGDGLWFGDLRTGLGPQGVINTRQPVTGVVNDLQQYRLHDWEEQVRGFLIPFEFNRAAYYLLPDRDAYWSEVRGWLAAIEDDLFHVSTESGSQSEANNQKWNLSLSYLSVTHLFHELSHALVGEEQRHGPQFAATLLMLWSRYVPDFDTHQALELAEQYDVEIGDPISVEDVSERTDRVHALFAKEAPTFPSDDEPIVADELYLSVVLHVGEAYTYDSDIFVTSTERGPTCVVTETYHDGQTSQVRFSPEARFTVGPGLTWNGLKLGDSDTGYYLRGTPTTPGRVRVKVTTDCPGGYGQEPTFVGYSEVIVRDPESSD